MTEPSFGARLQHLRTRRGLSREVFGGLVGRSGEWVKALERGRILMPRLPMLLRIAEVLHVNDLADLTGEQRVPVVSFSKGSHARTPVVADAMLASVPAADAEPDLRALRGRIDDASLPPRFLPSVRMESPPGTAAIGASPRPGRSAFAGRCWVGWHRARR